MLSRRAFLGSTARAASAAAGLAACPAVGWAGWIAGPGQDLPSTAPKARYWTTADARGRRLRRVPHDIARPPRRSTRTPRRPFAACSARRVATSAPGESGRCRARTNVNGELRSLVYGRPALGAPGPDREEALLPLPAGQQRALVRHVRVPAPVPVLPELGAVTVDARRPRGAVHVGLGHGGPGRRAPGAGHRLHLQRADGVRRIPARRRGGGRHARHPLGDGELRLREGSAARRHLPGAVGREDRPQGLQRSVLPPGVRRGAAAGPAKHRAGREEREAPGDRQPRRADAERLREGAAGAGGLGGRRTGAGRARPFHAVPPRLPADEPAADAGVDARARARHRDGEGHPVRVRRQRARARRQPHLLPVLQEGRHPARELLRERDAPEERAPASTCGREIAGVWT